MIFKESIENVRGRADGNRIPARDHPSLIEVPIFFFFYRLCQRTQNAVSVLFNPTLSSFVSY